MENAIFLRKMREIFLFRRRTLPIGNILKGIDFLLLNVFFDKGFDIEQGILTAGLVLVRSKRNAKTGRTRCWPEGMRGASDREMSLVSAGLRRFDSVRKDWWKPRFGSMAEFNRERALSGGFGLG